MTRTSRQRLRLALLRAFARLTPTPDPHRPPLTHRAPRILVIRPDHLGDLLFTTPALRALRQHYQDARITALVGPWGAPVLARGSGHHLTLSWLHTGTQVVSMATLRAAAPLGATVTQAI
jgi:hypothetical protein